MKGTLQRRILGALLLAIFGFFALASFVFGVTLDGIAAPAIQCSYAAVPVAGASYGEDAIITGERTFLPLGMSCSYDSPDDSAGPQTVIHSNWPATISCLVCLLLAFVGAVLLIDPNPLLTGRRRGANRAGARKSVAS